MAIFSILDTDLYKFTTSYAYMKLFPEAECTFTYKDRNRVKRSQEFLTKLKQAFKQLENLKLTDEEFKWCTSNASISFIPQYYWEWLKGFKYEADKINCWLDKDDVLNITVTDKCYKATLYEIPCLYLVPEINNADKFINWNKTKGMLYNKIELANKNGIMFSEFGTRRRFSYAVQDEILNIINQTSKTCVGTSNVHFAMRYGMKPIGTHPHEWFMFHGAQFGYDKANYLSLENWINVYDGDLGIGLSDCYGTDLFFHDMSLKQAKLLDGVRQDSGDEILFTNKTIDFYRYKNIDPITKTIVFSNSLDFPKALRIKNYCDRKIKCSFGIGTDLSCDVYDIDGNRYPYENEVMKMTSCRMTPREKNKPTVKLSDDFGKAIGDPKEIEYCKYKVNQILNGVA